MDEVADKNDILAEVLSEFARTLVTDFPIQAILDHLVLRIVEVLPITSAGVTLISPHADPYYVASSDNDALNYEKLQSSLGEGPCVAAYESGEAVSIPDLRHELRFPRFVERALTDGLMASFTFPLRHADGRLGALDLYRETPGPLDRMATATAQTLADVASAYLINAQNRVDLEFSVERFRENALHDALTTLPNRVLFQQRLDHAALRASRSKKVAAVLFADLDDFKQVNDTHGHRVGDELLVAVGMRLKGLLRPGDTLARLSGDEFVILCEDLDHPAQAEVVAARMNAAFVESFVLSGVEVRTSASIGVAFSGPGDAIPEQLLREADAAMYQAKAKGGARHQIIDMRAWELGLSRVGLERDLEGAAARGELCTDYQPIVSTIDRRTIGAEALLRWGPSQPGHHYSGIAHTAGRAHRPHRRDWHVGARSGLSGQTPPSAILSLRPQRVSQRVGTPAHGARVLHQCRVRAGRNRH